MFTGESAFENMKIPSQMGFCGAGFGVTEQKNDKSSLGEWYELISEGFSAKVLEERSLDKGETGRVRTTK